MLASIEYVVHALARFSFVDMIIQRDLAPRLVRDNYPGEGLHQFRTVLQ